MEIIEIQNEIVDEFNMFDSWMEKYEYLIDLGKNIPKISNDNKTDDNIIKGCQSKVWLHAIEDSGKVNFFADSDAIITKGIISLLIRTFSFLKCIILITISLLSINLLLREGSSSYFSL